MTNLACARKLASGPALRNACSGSTWPFDRRPAKPLPDERQEAIPHLRLIFRVARKILSQEPFLIEQPPDQDRQYEKNGEKPPPRAEGERRADEHDECAGIHRMPHERIRTRGNDRLAFGDLYRGRAVAVFLEHEED